MNDTKDLQTRLQEFVGQQAEPPFTGRDPVNQPMIRAWCDAMGDANPVYTDPEFAARSRHGGIVAPPAMIQAWFFPAMGTPRPPEGSPIRGLVDILRSAGFTSVVATNCNQEYVRYARPGDVLTIHQVIHSVSDEKLTGLGPGHFVDTRASITDANDETVCEIDYRRLFFRPRSRT